MKRADTWDSASSTFKYPGEPSQISFGISDGGSGAQSTSEWAGGLIQWGERPFETSVKSVSNDCFYN